MQVIAAEVGRVRSSADSSHLVAGLLLPVRRML
jgi:hypothetical protein